MIVSDINRGLFIVDVTEATTRTVKPASFSVDVGESEKPKIASLESTDTNVMVLKPDAEAGDGKANCSLSVVAKAPSDSARLLTLRLTGKTALKSEGQQRFRQVVSVFDQSASEWVEVDRSVVSQVSRTVEVQLDDPDRFVEKNTAEIKAKVEYFTLGDGSDADWTVAIDEFSWVWTP